MPVSRMQHPCGTPAHGPHGRRSRHRWWFGNRDDLGRLGARDLRPRRGDQRPSHSRRSYHEPMKWPA